MQATVGMDLTVAVVLSGAVILAYTALGGLKAVIYTDVFQMVVLLIGIVFIAVPIGLCTVGGWDGIVEHFSANPATASLVDWGAVGWKTVASAGSSHLPRVVYLDRRHAAHRRRARREDGAARVLPHGRADRVATVCHRQHADRHDRTHADARYRGPGTRDADGDHGAAAGRPCRHRHRGLHRCRHVDGRLGTHGTRCDIHQRYLPQAPAPDASEAVARARRPYRDAGARRTAASAWPISCRTCST